MLTLRVVQFWNPPIVGSAISVWWLPPFTFDLEPACGLPQRLLRETRDQLCTCRLIYQSSGLSVRRLSVDGSPSRVFRESHKLKVFK